VGQHDLAAEDRRRLIGEPLAAVGVVALREVREHQQPGAGMGGDLAGLPGGQVPVVAGQCRFAVGEGGFAHQHVRLVGQRERGVAQPGVHDEREPLAAPRLADLLQGHRPATGGQTALALQPPGVRAGDTGGGQAGRDHPPAIRLHQPVADGGDAVRQRARFQPERGRAEHRAGHLHRPFPQVQHVAEQRGPPEPGEDLLAVRRVAGLDQVRHLVQRHPLQHAGQAQAVIPVKVRDADVGDLARADPGEQHLPLGSLARVEQDPLAIPAQQVPIVVTAAGGRLTGRAKYYQLTAGHGTRR
jgi:hypothetical protein